jgi:hypothetical protein
MLANFSSQHMNFSRHTYIFLIAFMGLLSTMKAESLYAADKSTGSLSIANKEAMPGTTVDVPVTVSGFTNVIVMEIHIVFNKHVVTPNREAKDFVANFYPSIANAQFDLYNDSTIILTWYNLNGRTIPDGSKLFDLRLPFCMDGMSCAAHGSASPLTFNLSRTYLVGTGFVSIPLTLNNGSVYSPIETFDLIIDKTGNGSVKVNEALYTGTMSIPEQTNVTLQAFPDEGWQFDAWSGDLSGNENPARLLMDADKQVTASFSLKSYSISVAPNNENYGSVSGGGTVLHGAEVTLSATPATGHHFVRWTENDVEVYVDPEYIFTAVRDRSLLAHFEQTKFELAASVVPVGAGTVSGTGTFFMGDEVGLTASANEGYTFEAWKDSGGGVVSTQAVYAFYMPASDVTLVAHFELKLYTISAVPNDPAFGSVSGSGEYKHGTDVALEASPAPGFSFVHWTEDEQVVSTDTQYVFTATTDRELVAHFEKDTYTISANAYPSDGGLINGESSFTGEFEYGEEVTLHAVANEGFEFVGWLEGGNYIEGATAGYTFVVESDRSLVANFDVGSVIVQAVSNPAEGGTISGTGVYQYGDQVSLTAVPSTGYRFVKWTEDDLEVSTELTYVFTIEESRSLVAHFERKSYTISVSSAQAGMGTTSGGGTYQHGDEVRLEAVATTGHRFVNWTEGGTPVSTNPVYVFQATGNRILLAHFAAMTYTVTASVSPYGSGTVTGTGSFTMGETVTLKATASEGYYFSEWRNDEDEVISTGDEYSFSMPASNVHLTAYFALKSYTILASPNDPAYGSVSGSGEYEHGTQVVLEASPVTGYSFVHWTENEDVVSSDQVYSFAVVADRELVAHFEKESYSILAEAFPPDGGLINGESTYAGMFEYGEEVTLHAIANNGFEFVGWLEEGNYIAGADAEYTFTVNSNRSLVANFDVGSVIVQATASPVAGGSVTGAGIYHIGNEVNLIASPSTGYLFVRWTEGEQEVSTDTSYVFTIEGNRSLVAHFELKTYTVSVLANQEEMGSVSGGGTYQHGEQVHLEATPEAGHRFDNWSENGVPVSTERIYTFTATKDRELLASFVRENFTVTASVYPEGAGNVSGTGAYPVGEEVIMEATAEEGYDFIEWRLEGGEQVSDEPAYVFTMPAHDVDLAAHFSLKSYTISATANVPEYGSVNGAGDYDHGTEVVLEAVPSDGYHFVNWTENDTEVGAETTLVFQATADRNITANFAVNTFTIGASAGEGGSITPSGEIIVPYGSNASFAIEAAEGYDIAEVWVDGQRVGQVTSYVFENVIANHNIFAEFSPVTYEVSFHVNMTYVTMDYAGFDFNPEIHKVYLAGNMSGEWVIPGEDPDKQLMTKSNSNAKIYQITLHLEAGTYAYNYFLNEGWGGLEWEGNRNRELVVTGDMVVNDWFGSENDPTNVLGHSDSPHVLMYPIPARDWLVIESGEIISEIAVIDLLGRQLMHLQVNNFRYELNVSDFSNGIYLVRVHLPNSIRTHKVRIYR